MSKLNASLNLLRSFTIDESQVLVSETDVQLHVTIKPVSPDIKLYSIESGVYFVSRDEMVGVALYEFKDSDGNVINSYGFQLNNFKHPSHRMTFESYENEPMKDLDIIEIDYQLLVLSGAATMNAHPKFYTSVQYYPIRY